MCGATDPLGVNMSHQVGGDGSEASFGDITSRTDLHAEVGGGESGNDPLFVLLALFLEAALATCGVEPPTKYKAEHNTSNCSSLEFEQRLTRHTVHFEVIGVPESTCTQV